MSTNHPPRSGDRSVPLRAMLAVALLVAAVIATAGYVLMVSPSLPTGSSDGGSPPTGSR